MSDLRAISLFSGMGGDSLVIEQAGIPVVAYSECDRTAIESHQANFPTSQLLGNPSNRYDITKIPDETFLPYRGQADLIFAGFPCQGFSQGGKKLPNDPRNTLFREFIRVTHLVQPKYIIGENVPGLLTRRTESGDLYIDRIVSEFHRIGYRIQHQVLRASDFGVPQDRKRLFLVGIRHDLPLEYTFPEPNNTTPNLTQIVQFNMTGCIQLAPEDMDWSTIPSSSIVRDLSNTDSEQPATVHPYLRLKAKTRDESYRGTSYRNLLSFGRRGSPIHAEVVDLTKPSKTIICTYNHQPRLYVAVQNKNGNYLRCLLPDELKQIQGFPPHYQVCGHARDQIRQIGNAVPPPLVTRVVENLIALDASVSALGVN